MKEFIFPLRVYIEDTDCGGIVYHSNYLNYFERARSEWAEELGFGIEWQVANNVFFAVRYAKLDYLKPARVHQLVEVVTRILEVRPASLIYDQHLRLRGTTDTIFCKGEVKIASVSQSLRSQALPKELIKLLGEQL